MMVWLTAKYEDISPPLVMLVKSDGPRPKPKKRPAPCEFVEMACGKCGDVETVSKKMAEPYLGEDDTPMWVCSKCCAEQGEGAIAGRMVELALNAVITECDTNKPDGGPIMSPCYELHMNFDWESDRTKFRRYLQTLIRRAKRRAGNQESTDKRTVRCAKAMPIDTYPVVNGFQP